MHADHRALSVLALHGYDHAALELLEGSRSAVVCQANVRLQFKFRGAPSTSSQDDLGLIDEADGSADGIRDVAASGTRQRRRGNLAFRLRGRYICRIAKHLPFTRGQGIDLFAKLDLHDAAEN